jgi:DNA-binding response OmpR family regulator
VIGNRILIVATDPAAGSLLRAPMIAAGLEPEVVDDPAVAAGLLREHQYEVLLLDAQVPPERAVELTRAFDELSERQPVMLLIGDGPATSSPAEKHAHGIVRRPLDPEEVASLVLAIVDVRSRRALHTMALATMIPSVVAILTAT